MATQQAQIEVLLAQNRSLESKLAKASQSVHNSTQQPQPPAAAKRKATTSTETLQSEEDMTARIIEMVNASVAEALRTTVQTTVVNAVRAAVTEAFATVDSRLTNIRDTVLKHGSHRKQHRSRIRSTQNCHRHQFCSNQAKHGQSTSYHTQPSDLSLFHPAQRTHDGLK
ncbi:hypothetical protein MRX96_013923 [Rhipicephalus microplus]